MPPNATRKKKPADGKGKRGKVKKRHLTFEDMMAVHRVSAPAVSPDGKYVAYVTTKHDHIENTQTSTIRLLDIETKESKILTPGPGSHARPAVRTAGIA